MAEKKLVEAITSMDEDFAQWYTDVVKKAELIEYDLGADPEAAGRAVQGDGRRKCLYAHVHPGEPSSEREGSRGGFCTGGGLGDARRSDGTAGASVRAAHI